MPGFTWMAAWRGPLIWAPLLGLMVFSCLDNTVPEPITGPEEPVIPGSKLKALAHWDFNDCAAGILKDISGNAINGKIHGALCAEGVKGAALRFNGASDYVEVGADSRLDLDSNMTLSAWISPSDIAGTEYWYEIAAKRAQHNTSFGLTVKVGGRTAPLVQWYFGDGASFLSATASLVLAENAWTHIAVTREIEGKRSYMSFFVDGKPVKIAVVFGVPGKFPKTPFTIGRNSDPIANQSSFKGRIDEVSVFSKALDSAAIAGLYKSIKP
jgi:concanavalin A-like lectin/glucanase superfamily protein